MCVRCSVVVVGGGVCVSARVHIFVYVKCFELVVGEVVLCKSPLSLSCSVITHCSEIPTFAQAIISSFLLTRRCGFRNTVQI